MTALAARRRVAVVLFNLGGPDRPSAVRPFLFNLFRDPAILKLAGPLRLLLAAAISMTRARSARANYARMGGGSPLLPETLAQARALLAELAKRLPQADAEVFTAMRYWHPMTAEVAAAVTRFAPDDIVLLPLYPQFSTTTTGSSLKAWRDAYRGPGVTHAVCCYPDDEGLAEAHAEKIRQAWAAAGSPEPIRLLFSAHGLPEAVIAAGDPYQVQIEAAAAAVVRRLGPGWAGGDWRLCYQSRVGPLKWLGPSTQKAIGEAAEDGLGVLICPIAFVSEHVETLVELDHDYAALAEEVGCPVYVRAPTLGVQPDFIAALARLTQQALDRPAGVAPGAAWRCSAAWSGCPKTPETA